MCDGAALSAAVADGSEAQDGGRDGGGGSAGYRGRCMYDGTYVRRHTGQE